MAKSHYRNTKTRQLAGFTLIEVLLALSVFALAGLALLSTADTHFTHLSNIEQRMYADWVASDQLVEAKLDKQWPPKNNQKGKTTLAGHEWHWRQQVIKTTDNDMRQVVIEVRLNEKDDNELSSMMTYVSRSGDK
ncbi:type II secretion system minor pseudopilin GspI [Thalassotalea fusca]